MTRRWCTHHWFALVALLMLFPGVTHAQKVQLVPPDGEGGKYWPRRAGRRRAWSPTATIPINGRRPRTCSGRSRSPARATRRRSSGSDRLFLTAAYDQGKTPLDPLLRPRQRQAPLGDVRPRAPHRKRPGQERLGLRHADAPTASASTPTSATAACSACDLDGKQVWHVPLSPRWTPYHGMACSPLLLQGQGHHLPGPQVRRGFIAALRQAHRQGALEDAAQGNGRLGLADRHHASTARTRSSSAARCASTPTTRTTARRSGPAPATCSK